MTASQDTWLKTLKRQGWSRTYTYQVNGDKIIRLKKGEQTCYLPPFGVTEEKPEGI